MAKISILTKLILFVAILVVAKTSAKPTSPNNDTDNNEATKILNDLTEAHNYCRNQINKVKTPSEKRASCMDRCVYDKMGLMNNNLISIQKIAEKDNILKKHGYIVDDGSRFEYLKECVKQTNSKNIQGYCEVMEDYFKCLAKEKSVTSQSQTEEMS